MLLSFILILCMHRLICIFALKTSILNNCFIIFVNQGSEVEHATLLSRYHRVTRTLRLLLYKRLGYVFLEQLLLKYGWSLAGMLIVAIPIISTDASTNDVESRTQVQIYSQMWKRFSE